MTNTIKDSKINEKVSVTCRECKRWTNHLILSDITYKNLENIHFQWINEYQIIECQGCETISFRKTHNNSDEMEYAEDGTVEHTLYVDIYPNPEEGRNTIGDVNILPANIQNIYIETIKSINSGQRILTGIGIRAIVETICKDKKAEGNLERKIDFLVTQGVLTKEGATILHKLRLLGNSAAHEVKPHDNVQLGLALDVIDHLLQGVYVLPHHAKTKFE